MKAGKDNDDRIYMDRNTYIGDMHLTAPCTPISGIPQWENNAGVAEEVGRCAAVCNHGSIDRILPEGRYHSGGVAACSGVNCSCRCGGKLSVEAQYTCEHSAWNGKLYGSGEWGISLNIHASSL